MKLNDEEKNCVMYWHDRAHRWGMKWEFWDGYKRYRRAGYVPVEAAWCASSDWDIG